MLAGLMPSAALPGAWTLPAGEGQAIGSAVFGGSEGRFGGGAGQGLAGDLSKAEVELLLEYGLNDAFTVVLDARHVSERTGAAERVTGLGRTEVGIRGRLWQSGPAVVSAQALVRLPGSRRLEAWQGGDGAPQAELRLLAGRGFAVAGRHAFVDVQAAYRAGFGGHADEARLDLSAGIRAHERLMLLAQSFHVVERAGHARRRHQLQLSAVWEAVPGWSLQLGGRLTVAGRDVLRDRALLVGIWKSF